ncbi:MAG TPA: flagellar basal body P-ring formation chaperone FlgA [Candidatus Atribacteria bacterium]|jgi:flagella basal body P-ring formation protein FlgA|nr:flagellar basal body P-ring formation chaperone FlgA [Atribacterota bacterium]HOQ51192.1 flagellar basal body P-ring formation chaperone FlgA [Candidatus Atribacteria bacterium]HPT63197.1 flagellar basal body P-ring formation chaperone FlgA [Candidatus Atribacteria bacterium]
MKRKVVGCYFFWFLVILCLIGGGEVGALTLEVNLKEKVEVSAENIALGEIAEISYPEREWQRHLENLDLGYLPPPGGEREIKPEEIYERVVAQKVPQLDYIYFSGAPVCKVITKGELIARGELEEKIQEQLLDIFPFARKIEVNLSSPGEVIIPPGGEVNIVFSSSSSLKPWGTGNGTLEILREGKVEKTLPLRFEIQVYREVVRAKEKLSRGEVISEDQVCSALEVLDYRNEKAFSSVEEVEGKQTKREISAGAILTPSFIQEETLIKRGDLVTMVAKYGGIVVTGTGKARGEGSLGDVIVVENPDSKKRFEGEIIGERMVEVVVK